MGVTENDIEKHVGKEYGAAGETASDQNRAHLGDGGVVPYAAVQPQYGKYQQGYYDIDRRRAEGKTPEQLEPVVSELKIHAEQNGTQHSEYDRDGVRKNECELSYDRFFIKLDLHVFSSFPFYFCTAAAKVTLLPIINFNILQPQCQVLFKILSLDNLKLLLYNLSTKKQARIG
jgi:hypothetical protein